MSELSVGTLSGLAANNYVIDVASGSQLTQPGMILQVVQGSTSTPVSTTSTSYSNIGLSASITPTSTTSKILVSTSIYVDGRRAGTQSGANVQVVRDATPIYTDLVDGSLFVNAATASSFVIITSRIPVEVLDSPSTTSPLTYTVQGKVVNSAITAEFQRNNNQSFLTLMEVAA